VQHQGFEARRAIPHEDHRRSGNGLRWTFTRSESVRTQIFRVRDT
jgi:hypothetical protein